MAISMPTLGRSSRHGSQTLHGATQLPSSAEKMWLAGGALVGLLLVVIGYFTLITGQRSDTSHVRSTIDSARAQNSALRARLDALRAENKNLPAYEAALARAQLALPSTADVSNFLRTLQSIGSTTSTVVSGVTIGTPTAIAPPAAAGAATPGAAATVAAGTVTGAQLYSMSITAQVNGADANLDRFLRQLQEVQPRAVLVTNLQEGAGAAGAPAGTGSLAPGAQSLSLTMLAFIAPTNLTAPATPSASPSP